MNTKVSKQSGNDDKPSDSSSGSDKKLDKEAIINECMRRVKELIDYELRP
ncbi:MAG: hypothetical protein MK207_14605 [Saprospiraceae bacterium]|nr:hypothetical protein [Saprospiraceae bacterium]